MKTTDLDLELKEQMFSLYEDELDEFTMKYRKDKSLQKKICDEYGLFITYWEWDECYELNSDDGVIELSIHLDDLIEKIFNTIKNKTAYNYLPF